jgi:hypothetical protein
MLSGGRLDQQRDGRMSSLRLDYESLPLSVAKFLRGQADRIRRQCATSAIQIGKALLEAKRHLSHGRFLRWVECEVCIPVRTAQAYMRVANWASDKGATVAHLSPSALYLLSASGVSEEFAERTSSATVGRPFCVSRSRSIGLLAWSRHLSRPPLERATRVCRTGMCGKGGLVYPSSGLSRY